MTEPSPAVKNLLRRIADGDGIAFVAGWKIHGNTASSALARRLIYEEGPDLWALTKAGWGVVFGPTNIEKKAGT